MWEEYSAELPNSLHLENLDFYDPSYQGGLVVNATRTPKEFKFDKADVV